MFRCECGQVVDRRSLVQVAIILQPNSPVRAVFKFRCPRCGRLVERVAEYAQLAAIVAGEISAEQRPEGREERFRDMGPITPEEVREFRRQLEEMKGLPPEIFSDSPGEGD